jgi:tetratricopeptide (TPR) repeat protein
MFKAITFSLTLFFLSQISFAQNESFEELEVQVLEKVEMNLWEDVLLISSDLVISEPRKGDGYFYTAMAFYHLENPAKMEKYLAKAERKADASLQEKIDAFKAQMNADQNAEDFQKDALAFEKSNRPQAACEAWEKAWNEDKTRIDCALNAVGHYLDFKDYQKALEILNDPQVSADENAQLIIQKIYETPQMVAKEGYESSMKDGQDSFDRGNFQNALTQFKNALYHKSNDSEAKRMKAKCEEELAWEKANNSEYIEDTERYADNYPSGKYISRAKNRMKSSYVSIARNYYQSGNESGMVDMHNRYLKRFPGDGNIVEIKNMLLDFYYSTAGANFKAGNFSTAKSYYNQYLVVDSNGSKANLCRTQIKRCDRRMRQRSVGFLMYSRDEQSPIGLDFGRLNKTGVGGYMNIKMNKEIFTGFDVLYEIDDAGNHTRPGSVKRTGEEQEANICVSGGLTFKLVHPFYAHIGGGFGYYPVYQKADTYFSSGDFWEEDWLKNTDHTEWRFFPEAGLRMNLGNVFSLKYGFMYQDDIIQQLGVGIAF